MVQNRLGAYKTASKRIGISLEAYIEKVESGYKWCTFCKEFHDRDEFSFDRQRPDGLATKCKNVAILLFSKYMQKKKLLTTKKKVRPDHAKHK